MPGLLRQVRVTGPNAFQILRLELFQIEQRILRFVRRANQLVELDLHRFGITILRVLDEEHHQERDDGGAGIDDKLPSVVEVEERPAQAPDNDNAKGKHESTGAPHDAGCRLGEPREPAAVVERAHPAFRSRRTPFAGPTASLSQCGLAGLRPGLCLMTVLLRGFAHRAGMLGKNLRPHHQPPPSPL